jgi:tetratricopeptide (TPR) repeat protein
MKKHLNIVIALGCFLLSQEAYTQKDNPSAIDKASVNLMVSKSIELYDLGRVNDAISLLKKAELKDTANWKIQYCMGKCFYDLTMYYAAEECANRAFDLITRLDDAEAGLNELLGNINHRLGRVDVAAMHFKKTAQIMGTKAAKNNDILVYIEQCELALADSKSGVLNLRKPLANSLNTIDAEYAPILTREGKELFFTARRPETTGNNINPDDQQYYEDMYHAIWDESLKDWALQSSTFIDLNTNGFDALSFVSDDGLYGLCTINTSASEKTTKSSDIFEITGETPFRFSAMDVIKNKSINTDYFEGSATQSLAPNGGEGEIMVFITDRKAEDSGMDMFVVSKIDGTWGTAKALPKNINSLGDETTPYLTNDGKFLFFSSNSLPGYGGYDIYYCQNVDGVWSAPVNLGLAVNSVNNDTHFQFNPKTNQGVFASICQNGDYFSYDIFQADLSKMPYPFVTKE